MISKAHLESCVTSKEQMSRLGEWVVGDRISSVGAVDLSDDDSRISHLGAFDSSQYISRIGNIERLRHMKPGVTVITFGSRVGFVG